MKPVHIQLFKRCLIRYRFVRAALVCVLVILECSAFAVNQSFAQSLGQSLEQSLEQAPDQSIDNVLNQALMQGDDPGDHLQDFGHELDPTWFEKKLGEFDANPEAFASDPENAVKYDPST